MSWSGGLAQWQEDDIAFISVAFSWRLREAANLARYWHERGYAVRVGGPATMIPQNAKLIPAFARVGGNLDALVHHNPDATIASRGCPVGCWFCVVPKYEGKTFTLIPDFTPRPILCDNNLSALPTDYQEHIIRRYQATNTPLVDANSGFEPHSFDRDTYARWRVILRGPWRFALDEVKELEDVRRMMQVLKDEPRRKKRVYVLIGNEPIAACYERVRKVIEWGGEPYCQPLLPLNALDRRAYRILHDWTATRLMDFARWSNRFLWKYTSLSAYSGRTGQRSSFAEMNLEQGMIQ